MSAYDTGSLAGLVEADETVIGGFEPGAVGRSKGKRKIVEIAVELGPEVSKLGRAPIFRTKAKHIADRICPK
jgi:hypothetical protein